MTKQYIKIDTNGSKLYYKDREMEIFHREDGPAIEYAHGSKFWFINGRLHREDGPAIEFADGPKEWYLNGRYHREDRPAVEWADGLKFWYLDGKQLTEEEHTKLTAKEVVVSMDEIAKMLDISVEKLKIKM